MIESAGSKNVDILLIIGILRWHPKYAQNWDAHRQHSQPYVGRGGATVIGDRQGRVTTHARQRRGHGMRLSPNVIGWLPLCAAHRLRRVSPRGNTKPGRYGLRWTGPSTEETSRWRRRTYAEFGFDPGPIDGIYTAQTQAAVRAYQGRYGLRSRACSITRPACS